MNNKLLPLIAGAALVVGVSAAQAAEPIQLANAQMDTVTAGTGGWDPTYFQYDRVDVNFNTYNYSGSTIEDNIYLDGNSASAGAKADAIDPSGGWLAQHGYPLDSYAKADTLSVTVYGSGSFAASTSAAAIEAVGD